MAPRKPPTSRWDQFEFALDLPSSLKAASPTAGKDPVQVRRDTMAAAIELQRKLWEDAEYTEERTVKRDGRMVKEKIRPREWWKASGEIVWITPRYGTRFFKIKEDAPVAKLKENQVVPFLEALKEAVIEGEFDEQMEGLATRKRG